MKEYICEVIFDTMYLMFQTWWKNALSRLDYIYIFSFDYQGKLLQLGL
jgi:hypothetical protein